MGLGDGCSDYPSVSASSTLDDGSTGSGLIAVGAIVCRSNADENCIDAADDDKSGGDCVCVCVL